MIDDTPVREPIAADAVAGAPRSSAAPAPRSLKSRSGITMSWAPEGVPQDGLPTGHGTGPAMTADHRRLA